MTFYHLCVSKLKTHIYVWQIVLSVILNFVFFGFRFVDQQANRRRQQAEKLAADSLKDAKPMPKTQDNNKTTTATALANAKTNGPTASAPVTPAVTPTAEAQGEEN